MRVIFRPRRLLACSAALVVALAGAGAAPVAAGPAPAAGQSPPSGANPATPERSGAGESTITLLTGDTVAINEVGDRTQVEFEPGPGRAGMGYVERRDGDRITVIPADAVGKVASGEVDRRLFDISLLDDLGYTDDAYDHIPAIVQRGGSLDRSLSVLRAVGAQVVRQLDSVGGVAVELAKARLGTAWERLASDPSIERIWLDGALTPALAESTGQIGATAAWESGWTGDGTTVAVVDTGIDADHPDLADQVVNSQNFTDAGHDVGIGHGTHVASTIAGTGAASDGTYTGVAPDARLLDAKVCTGSSCSDSAILAGMEWAVEQGADVVNVSLGSAEPSDGTSLLEQAIDTHTEESGALFVVAAGNYGVVGEPGAASSALTVGSVDKLGQLATNSGRGPRLGDYLVKPELVAPGVAITAASPDEGYTTMSGTSMATPHVAGAAAILGHQHPDWEAGELKAALVGSAQQLDGPGVFAQGTGRVDVARAVDQPLTVRPSGLHGFLPFPEGGDDTQELTYHNAGDNEVTLDLRAELIDAEGARARADALRLSPARVTVPAGGSAEVTASFDTEALGHEPHGGVIVATGGDTSLRTPVSAFVEPESYDVTLRGIDREGLKTPMDVVLADLDTGETAELRWDEGSYHARVPKGRYTVTTMVPTLNDAGFARDVTLASEPSVVVDEDVQLTFDARDGVEPSVEPPTDGLAESFAPWLGLQERMGERETLAAVRGGNVGAYVIPDARVDADERESAERDFTFMYVQTLAEPADSGPSPVAYNLALADRSGIPADLDYRVDADDLARIDTQYGSQGTGAGFGAAQNSVILDEFPTIPVATGHRFASPGQRTVYVSADRMRWMGHAEVQEVNGQSVFIHESGGVERFAAGERYTRAWNLPAFGPSARATHDTDGMLRILTTVADTGQPGRDQINPFDLSGIDGSLVLSSDGVEIGRSDTAIFGGFDVPAKPTEYVLDYEATRVVEWSRYASKVSAQWGFTSAAPTGGQAHEQPLLGIKASGAFDARGRAPVGERFTLDIHVVRPDPAVAVTALTVEASYNDGRTWRRVPLRRTPDGGVATIVHPPRGAEFVSLRVRAADRAGNTVDQTVIRAYGLAPRR